MRGEPFVYADERVSVENPARIDNLYYRLAAGDVTDAGVAGRRPKFDFETFVVEINTADGVLYLFGEILRFAIGVIPESNQRKLMNRSNCLTRGRESALLVNNSLDKDDNQHKNNTNKNKITHN